MRLIGRYMSPFTRRVAVTLGLLELPFEHQPLTPWHHLEALRQLNPVGRVPALVLDNGEVLIDSNVILDYLDEIVGPERALTPPYGTARRLVQRLTATATGIMDKAVAARYEVTLRPEHKIHQPWIEHNQGQIRSALGWLERQAKIPWMTGRQLTQADISVTVMGDFLRLIDKDLMPKGAYPAIDDLITRASSLAPFSSTQPEISQANQLQETREFR
jgi:glutathione S-transferase